MENSFVMNWKLYIQVKGSRSQFIYHRSWKLTFYDTLILFVLCMINDWRVCNHILTGWIEIMHWYSHYWLSVITHHISDIDLIEMYSVKGCMHYLYGNYSVFGCFCLLPIYTINLFSFACILRVLAWKVLKFFLQLTWLINEYNVLLVPKKIEAKLSPCSLIGNWLFNLHSLHC